MDVKLSEVAVQAVPLLERFEPLLDPEAFSLLRDAAEAGRELLRGRTVWNVNSTATGGGVAEMLAPLVAYGRGAGIDVRWLVIGGDAEFFRITKRIHNRLHAVEGDGGDLGDAERAHYDRVMRANCDELTAVVHEGDIVLLHDPQTAGLVEPLQRLGALVIWRCHVGVDQRNDLAEQAWDFLRPMVEPADAIIMSRKEFAPDWLAERVHVVPPSIDPFSAKNEDMDRPTVRSVLAHVGVISGDPDHAVAYTRRDGSPGRVDHVADIVRAGPVPGPDSPLVVQVSRWDRLKDMAGVMLGFAEHVDGGGDAHLVLAGPNVTGVADDPEGAEVLQECIEAWRTLPHAARARIQLVCLPMADVEENAAIVNALQRHAAVVVQKSLAEGFGLTVAEAMWKGRPVVASAIGGIRDQVVHGETGILLDDPTDLAAFGRAVTELLADPERADRMGAAARQRVLERFIAPRHLIQYGEIFAALLAGR